MSSKQYRTEEVRRIVLFGPPAAGKSVVGAELSQRLKWPLIDLDSEIESESGKSIDEIFRVEGEEHFRRREREALKRLLCQDQVIISVGGGAIQYFDLHQFDEGSYRVLLDAKAETLAARVIADHERGASIRPLLSDALSHGASQVESRIARLVRERAAKFREAASLTVSTDFLRPAHVAAAIQELLGLRSVMVVPYEFKGALQLAMFGNTYCESVIAKLQSQRRPLIAVIDRRVAQLYPALAAQLEVQCGNSCILFDATEQEKNLERYSELLDELVARGASRESVIVSVGGGVTGDVVGFAASTLFRGVGLVHIPTTVVAQVDSAIGGKTGVNLKAGKNLAGTFYPASHVIADTDLLKHLPDREFFSGLAEVVKSALIGDPHLFEMLERSVKLISQRDADILLEAIQAAGQVKIEIVAKDPLEVFDQRKFLNFGHTVGHALEKLTSYSQFLHGEAVSIGMAVALRIGERKGITSAEVVKRGIKLLRDFNLPTEIPSSSLAEGTFLTDRPSWEAALQVDKKRKGAVIDYVFVGDFGKPLLYPLETKELVSLLEHEFVA